MISLLLSIYLSHPERFLAFICFIFCQQQKTNMSKPKPILTYLKKSDPKLLVKLSPTERSQAIKQFGSIWEGEGSKVSVVLNRRRVVKSNRSRQEVEEQERNRQIAIDLQNKMKTHAKKRSTLQLEKMKSYHNLGQSWKDRVKVIASNQKVKRDREFQKAKEFNSKIKQFWESRKSPKSSHSNLSYKLVKHQSVPYQDFFVSQQPLEHEDSHNFMTEVRLSPPKDSRNRKSQSTHKANFPALDTSHRLKTENKPTSRSIIVQKHRTVTINAELKSREHKQKQENMHFQNAMKKMTKIVKARGKAIQIMKQNSQQSKQKSRIFKETLLKRYRDNQPQADSSVEKKKTTKKHSVDIKRNSNVSSVYSSQVRLKHEELEQERFRLRTQAYDESKEKQHRGRFHRMVRDAVSLYRLQALRRKE